MPSVFKKIIISVVVLSIIASGLLIKPKPADAVFRFVYIIGHNPFTDKEITDALAWIAAKVILHNLTTSLINFIQGGESAGGRPLFVTNVNQFLRQGADAAAGSVLQELLGPQICSPFRIIIPRVVRRQYSFRLQTQCTLSQIFDAFRNSPQIAYQDFSNFGWDGFLALSQPNNNPYSIYLMSLDEIDRRRAEEASRRTTEANWGSGFLPVQQCVQYERDDLTGAQSCVQYKTTTPGKILEDQLSQAFGTNLSQLALADELNEVMAAAVSRLMTWAFVGGGNNNSGLSGFSMGEATRPGGQFYYEPTTGQSPLGRELNSIIESNIAAERSYMEFKQNSYQALSNTLNALKALDAILSGTTTAITNNYVAEIGGPPPVSEIPLGGMNLSLIYLPDTIVGGCRSPVNMSRADIAEEISAINSQRVRIGGASGEVGEIGEASSTISSLERLRNGVSTAEDAAALSGLAMDYSSRSQSRHDPVGAEEEFNGISSRQSAILIRLGICIQGLPPTY